MSDNFSYHIIFENILSSELFGTQLYKKILNRGLSKFWRNAQKDTFSNIFKQKTYCSTTGKPTRSFATERVSLDSV